VDILQVTMAVRSYMDSGGYPNQGSGYGRRDTMNDRDYRDDYNYRPDNRGDNRNFFERAGDRIRDKWNDWTDNDRNNYNSSWNRRSNDNHRNSDSQRNNYSYNNYNNYSDNNRGGSANSYRSRRNQGAYQEDYAY
jgi:hypothetical protein